MASNDTAGHRRINEVLLAYWQKLRQGKPYPKESEVEISELADIWDSCFLVKREGTGADIKYTYLYLGSALVDAYGGDLSSREICEKLVFPSSMPLVHKFEEVMESREATLDESEFVNSRDVPVKYRSLMLPLGDADGNVAFILGGMRWKSY